MEESRVLSLRENHWKYIRPSGGNDPAWITEKGIEGGYRPGPQLYHLEEDPGEQKNLAEVYPERVKAMEAKLVEIEKREKRPEQ